MNQTIQGHSRRRHLAAIDRRIAHVCSGPPHSLHDAIGTGPKIPGNRHPSQYVNRCIALIVLTASNSTCHHCGDGAASQNFSRSTYPSTATLASYPGAYQGVHIVYRFGLSRNSDTGHDHEAGKNRLLHANNLLD